MDAELHIFDPDGDLLLVLSRAPVDDSEYNIEGPGEDSTCSSENAESETDGENVDDAALNGEASMITAPHIGGSGAHKNIGTSADSTSSESILAPNDKDPQNMVHMLVSSKHMMLASPVFKAMLQYSTFKEGSKLTSTGKVEVPLPDDDPVPFQVILDIIHGRNRRVPREIDLELLTGISILVDKYQMAEAVVPYSEGWIDGLYETLPMEYITSEERRDVHRYLGISWVFDKEMEFKKMTKLVERGCYASLAEDIEDGLLIPDLIIASILKLRQEALFELYDLIEQNITKYQRREILCPRTDSKEYPSLCDSLLLGTLLKSATTLGLFPIPEAPYRDISFDEMTTKMYALDIHAICDKINRPWIGGSHPKPTHGLKETIHEKVESLKGRLSGLYIQDFKVNEKSSR